MLVYPSMVSHQVGAILAEKGSRSKKMNQIKCPHCGTVFTINETEYSQLLAQVRGQEFEKEIHERLERERTGAFGRKVQEYVTDQPQ